jgi:hypothetical protein
VRLAPFEIEEGVTPLRVVCWASSHLRALCGPIQRSRADLRGIGLATHSNELIQAVIRVIREACLKDTEGPRPGEPAIQRGGRMVSDRAHRVQRVSRYCSAESMGAMMVHTTHNVPQMTRVAAGLQKAIPTATK